jgi:hypothetical protein
MDMVKMRACAPLLEPPGDRVVWECLDEIERLEAALAVAQAVNAKMRLSCRSIAETFIPHDESQCALALSEMRDAIDTLANVGGK